MGKFFLIIFSLLLIFGGIYGLFYLLSLRDAEIELNNAINTIYTGNFKEAEETLTRVTAQYETTVIKAPALYLLAELYEKKGEWTAAAETYKSILLDTEIPTDSIWHLRALLSASKLFRQSLAGTSRHRVELFEDYIEMVKKRIEEMDGRGGFSTLSAQINHFIQSLLIPTGSRLAELFNNKSIRQDLETELAFLYLETGRFTDAEKLFLSLKTKTSAFGLAQLYLKTDREEKGVEILEELLKYDTTGRIYLLYFEEAYNLAKRLEEAGEFQKAIEVYQKIINNSREFQSGPLYRKASMQTGGEGSSTEGAENPALRAALFYEELGAFQLASYYYKRGNLQKALSFLEQVLKNRDTSKDEEALLISGYIYYDSRDFYRALKIFNDFIKRYPRSPYFRNARDWKAMAERAIRYLN
jgi:tetratricopeptide (TPR) repeat protein